MKFPSRTWLFMIIRQETIIYVCEVVKTASTEFSRLKTAKTRLIVHLKILENGIFFRKLREKLFNHQIFVMSLNRAVSFVPCKLMLKGLFLINDCTRTEGGNVWFLFQSG